MVYGWAGYKAVPFHGDEADHLYKSIDFNVAFVQREPQALQVELPVQPDSTEHIRLLTGNVHATLTGYALWSMGVQPQAWPKAWYYGQPVDWNITQGHWPEQDALERGRLPHTLLVMLSVPLVFGLVWRLQPPAPFFTALVAALLVGTHPVWLLHGRRVMQESVLIVISIVLMLSAIEIAQRWRYGCLPILAILSGLCVVAKPTGLITVLSVFVALGLIALRQQNATYHLTALGMTGVASIITYFALTPALWGDPINVLHYTITERQTILRGQTQASHVAYDNALDQGLAMITQPFIAPTDLQYYETPAFDGILAHNIANYKQSGYVGWQHGQWSAWLWTGLSVVGGVHLWRQRREPRFLVILVWVIVTGLMISITTPLEWQRYYLLWTITALLLASIGFGTVIKWLSGWKSTLK